MDAQALTERDQTPPSTNTTVTLDNGSAFTNMALPMGTVARVQAPRETEVGRSLPQPLTFGERREAMVATLQTAVGNKT
jgi:hypothetical protein